MPEFSAAHRGATILRQFRHPEDWRDGDTAHDERLFGCFVLPLNELRRGAGAPYSDLEALANAAAIKAWADYVGLVPDTGRIIAQNPDYMAYLVIPKVYWRVVLPILQAL